MCSLSSLSSSSSLGLINLSPLSQTSSSAASSSTASTTSSVPIELPSSWISTKYEESQRILTSRMSELSKFQTELSNANEKLNLLESTSEKVKCIKNIILFEKNLIIIIENHIRGIPEKMRALYEKRIADLNTDKKNSLEKIAAFEKEKLETELPDLEVDLISAQTEIDSLKGIIFECNRSIQNATFDCEFYQKLKTSMGPASQVFLTVRPKITDDNDNSDNSDKERKKASGVSGRGSKRKNPSPPPLIPPSTSSISPVASPKTDNKKARSVSFGENQVKTFSISDLASSTINPLTTSSPKKSSLASSKTFAPWSPSNSSSITQSSSSSSLANGQKKVAAKKVSTPSISGSEEDTPPIPINRQLRSKRNKKKDEDASTSSSSPREEEISAPTTLLDSDSTCTLKPVNKDTELLTFTRASKEIKVICPINCPQDLKLLLLFNKCCESNIKEWVKYATCLFPGRSLEEISNKISVMRKNQKEWRPFQHNGKIYRVNLTSELN